MFYGENLKNHVQFVGIQEVEAVRPYKSNRGTAVFSSRNDEFKKHEKTMPKTPILCWRISVFFLKGIPFLIGVGRLLILLHVPLLKAKFVAAEAGQEIPKIEPMTILKPTRPKKPQSPPKKQKKYHFFERQLEGG